MRPVYAFAMPHSHLRSKIIKKKISQSGHGDDIHLHFFMRCTCEILSHFLKENHDFCRY
jgi:hypothetical protein